MAHLPGSFMQTGMASILLLAQFPHQVPLLESVLRCFGYSVAIAATEEQALIRANQYPPFLIILAGDHHRWSPGLFQQLRTFANTHHITLVALTDFHNPSWVYQEENPGFDGFLVSPITSEVLMTLVQSAHTRQICCPVGIA